MEMVVYGGDVGDNTHASDGAAYNPLTDTWRLLAAPPIVERSGCGAVWTGREMLVWGGVNGEQLLLDDGASYDPADDLWRRLSPGPLDGRVSPVVVWTGDVMIVAAGVTNSDQFDVGAAAYRPNIDAWLDLDGPKQPARSSGVWTGRELVSVGQLVSFDLVQWSPLPEPPVKVGSGATATWTGTSLVVVGGGARRDSATDTAVVLVSGAE
jgi:N-acetylneuraminic acid mutarotase